MPRFLVVVSVEDLGVIMKFGPYVLYFNMTVEGGRVQSYLGQNQETLPDDRNVFLGGTLEHFGEVHPGKPDALPIKVDLMEPTGADTFAFARINQPLACQCKRKHQPTAKGDGRRDAARRAGSTPGRRQLS